MAYSLGDPYRPLRIVLRLNGLLIGWAFGLVLFFFPLTIMTNAGLYNGGAIWPARLAGAALIAVGLFFILGAQARAFDLATLITCTLFHTLCALTLLLGYLQGELRALALGGQLLLLLLFVLCLVGALAPVRYFRAEYQM